MLNIDTSEQIGKAIGRMTSRSQEILIASGTTQGTTQNNLWLDAKMYAGGIVDTPVGYTGTLYILEADNERGISGGRLGDDTGANVTMTNMVGARPYTMPDAVFPAHYINLELSPAAKNDWNFKLRFKG